MCVCWRHGLPASRGSVQASGQGEGTAPFVVAKRKTEGQGKKQQDASVASAHRCTQTDLVPSLNPPPWRADARAVPGPGNRCLENVVGSVACAAHDSGPVVDAVCLPELQCAVFDLEHYPTTRPHDVRNALRLDGEFTPDFIHDARLRPVVDANVGAMASASPVMPDGSAAAAASSSAVKVMHFLRDGHGVHDIFLQMWAEADDKGCTKHMRCEQL